MIRAKFTVQEIHQNTWQVPKVVLRPQYDPALPEDATFQKATPNGELWMTVDNPAAMEQLRLGQVFYVDFTPVSK